MRAKLLSRLERLEAVSQDARQSVMQVGSLKKLPDDFVGERHVVVVKRYPSGTPNWEPCEFEERPGPGAVRGKLPIWRNIGRFAGVRRAGFEEGQQADPKQGPLWCGRSWPRRIIRPRPSNAHSANGSSLNYRSHK